MTTANAPSTPEIEIGEPVQDFPLQFMYYTHWKTLFDAQAQRIKDEVARARLEGRLVIYLSCPISNRGGGYAGTNVDIAHYVERKVLQRWGEGFWVLNPAKYQLESKAGKGLLDQIANDLHIDLEELEQLSPPGGGDYLRMWTKVLVEDEHGNAARNFDAFYFLGPRDVFSFFTENGSQSMTAGIQSYFARKIATDAAFRDYFSVAAIPGGDVEGADSTSEAVDRWSELRRDFLRFYGLKASANFSLGSHDEWAILRLVNKRRRKTSEGHGQADGDVGDQLAAYFDGVQVSLSASEAPVSRGYAI